MVRRFKSRKSKLEESLTEILSGNTKNIDAILNCVDEYEKDNLDTINKLKRVRQLELKKINGALKQTIDSHGDINKVLIGSAAKRIWGALLESDEFRIKRKISLKTFVIGLLFGLLLCIFA
jgi:hypothetical protein